MVRFLGYRQDIPGLLGIMDMVVMPSLRESFGLVAIEAMAMEVPVIASRIGGLEEVVEHERTGVLVAPGDAVVLADHIQQLKGDPGMRKKMGKAGRQRVEARFGLDSTIRRTEDLYLDLLSSRVPS
jgi:glycosyltransferase involved in cell wall biosynthesis